MRGAEEGCEERRREARKLEAVCCWSELGLRLLVRAAPVERSNDVGRCTGFYTRAWSCPREATEQKDDEREAFQQVCNGVVRSEEGEGVITRATPRNSRGALARLAYSGTGRF